jgi:hypothetical protein
MMRREDERRVSLGT